MVFKSLCYVKMPMQNAISVLKSERELLEYRFGLLDEAKKEIVYLGKEANLQGSETFGHDNPILETKREKQTLLSAQQEKFKGIAEQLASCLTLTEDQVAQRKGKELQENGRISIDVGSVVTLEIQGAPKINKFLITGLTQGTKLDFMGSQYSTICPSSPIRKSISGKFAGDAGEFTNDGKTKKVSILSVE